MASTTFLKKLQEELLRNLPGNSAHATMSPPYRLLPSAIQIQQARKAGVCIVLFQKEQEWHTLLMLRTQDATVHSAQISLPGGSVDSTDGSITYTALRELQEEMGIAMHDVEILGSLSPLYIPPSKFYITPLVVYWPKPYATTIHAQEVQAVFSIKLSALFAPTAKNTMMVTPSNGHEAIVPAYETDGITIWGATAMVLAELEAVMKRNIV